MGSNKTDHWSEDWMAEMLELIASGRSLNSVCKQDNMPGMSTVFRIMADDAIFRENYDAARDERTETIADETMRIADEENADDVPRAKLRVDTRKWFLARMNPKKYGDKQFVDTNVKSTILVQDNFKDDEA